MNQLLTVSEVAAEFQVSKTWVYKHASGARRPELPSVKLGKTVRFRREQVAAFIVECQRILEGRG